LNLDEWLTEATKIFGLDIFWEEIKRSEDAELRTHGKGSSPFEQILAQSEPVGFSHNHVADLSPLMLFLEEGEDQWSITERKTERTGTRFLLMRLTKNIEDDVASRVEDHYVILI